MIPGTDSRLSLHFILNQDSLPSEQLQFCTSNDGLTLVVSPPSSRSSSPSPSSTTSSPPMTPSHWTFHVFPNVSHNSSNSKCAAGRRKDSHSGSPFKLPWSGSKRGPKKGWTQKEHVQFLVGVQLFGRGNWKKISTIVQSRSPKQIQSHAQKYFLRQQQTHKEKASIHDFTHEDLVNELLDPEARITIRSSLEDPKLLDELFSQGQAPLCKTAQHHMMSAR